MLISFNPMNVEKCRKESWSGRWSSEISPALSSKSSIGLRKGKNSSGLRTAPTFRPVWHRQVRFGWTK